VETFQAILVFGDLAPDDFSKSLLVGLLVSDLDLMAYQIVDVTMTPTADGTGSNVSLGIQPEADESKLPDGVAEAYKSNIEQRRLLFTLNEFGPYEVVAALTPEDQRNLGTFSATPADASGTGEDDNIALGAGLGGAAGVVFLVGATLGYFRYVKNRRPGVSPSQNEEDGESF